MTTDMISQTVLFPNLFAKPLLARFDQPHTSSDGGAVLLKAAEKVYGLVAGFVRCLVDRREPGKVRHTLADLLGQRIFGIACGHPDGNDAEHLAADPIHKLLLGRDPVAGAPLASQPTISRFENCATRTALYRMGRELATRVIERHARRLDGRARRIIIDLDPTDDRTHGAQQLSFFNGYYDSWCYLPLLAFLTFDRRPWTMRAPRAPGPDGLHTSTPKRAMPAPLGATPGVSSSRPKSSASTTANRATTRASSSPIFATRPASSTSGSTAPAATSRTVSRNCDCAPRAPRAPAPR